MNDQQPNQCSLSDKSCIPCAGGVEPLKGRALTALLDQLPHGWDVIEEHHLQKTFKFKDFKQALDYVNAVGAIAEEQGHHPDIFLAWGKVKLTIWTHKIDGLHESDFIFAAKTDKLYNP
jgi:4a-hydroxytetrahydrobiopterin dehydratase